MRSSVGPALVVAGVVLVVAGLLASSGMLSWFGRLPGDIRIERPHTRIYIPLTSMLLVSVALSLIAAVLRRLK
jgi:membrane protein implicated in regulation of membrane protease activity